ncbi:MAG: SMI1/KNR4 family protein [bacterium]|nr:SMI1/KNR4 family protein [bacterium]
MTNKNIDINEFWIQPSKGFVKEKNQGVTEDTLNKKEQEFGIIFPLLYRQVMKLQNGGYIRKQSFGIQELFINGAKFESIDRIETFCSFLDGFMSEDEIKETIVKIKYCYPERLIIFSRMDGHSLACFDYGWLQKEAKTDPKIVIFLQDDSNIDENNFGYEEILRVSDFNEFISRLVYYGYEAESYFIGLSTDLQIDAFVKVLSQTWGGTCEIRKDDHYGWFNFNEWYYLKEIKLNKADLQIIVSPNQYNSGTFLFQNHPKLNIIIEITPPMDTDIDDNSFVNSDTHNAILSMKDQLIEVFDSVELLLYPFRESFIIK